MVSTPSAMANVRALMDRFPQWLAEFDRSGPFARSGQLEWHRRTIDRRLELGSGAAAVLDETFLRCLYETLRAWGIGVRVSKLHPFAAFAKELRRHAETIATFDAAAIDDEQLQVRKTRDELWSFLERLKIVGNEARLVSGTKTLHHILPDLVVPMDRAYTQVFFGWGNPRFQYRQRDCFVEAFEAFVEIARSVEPAKFVGAGWRSSRTKVLDNALVAVVQSLAPRPPRAKRGAGEHGSREASTSNRSGTGPSADLFRRLLHDRFTRAEGDGQPYSTVVAGDLHRAAGGYPGPQHRMAVCCGVMRREFSPGDRVVAEPPKGVGASLTIEFMLPRRWRAA